MDNFVLLRRFKMRNEELMIPINFKPVNYGEENKELRRKIAMDLRQKHNKLVALHPQEWVEFQASYVRETENEPAWNINKHFRNYMVAKGVFV